MRKVLLLLAVASLLVICCSAAQCGNVIRVKWDSPANGPGDDWSRAYRTVTAGLNAAVSNDEVWVAGDADHPYIECITLKNGVALYGGFAGNETERDQRDWTANVTILDGNQAGSVVTVIGASSESTRIDGFTVQNGTGTYSAPHRDGGGVYCDASSVTITNNTIRGNAVKGDFVGGVLPYTGRGGGIFYRDSGSAVISGNVILRNSAAMEGGGIYCASSSAGMFGNTITNNTASSGKGGGICCRTYCGAILHNAIKGNTASKGGGIDIEESICTVVGNVILANGANVGSGVYCKSSAMITNNTIAGNSGPIGAGAITIDASPHLSNNIIAFNSAGVDRKNGIPVLRSNCVYGNASSNYFCLLPGVGDISEDPLLADRAWGGYHIQPGSPCRNAGWNEASGIPSLDIDGQARVEPSGGRVDIGADESDGTIWPAVEAAVVRVKPDGDDRSDGSTWSQAVKTVQAGIDLASRCGGEVWVAAGVYKEVVYLPPFVHIYGGFSGTETERTERSWAVNRPVIDAELNGTTITVRAGVDVNTVDGFTVRNGWNGILSEYASLIIANNTVTGSSYASATAGIRCERGGQTITNNIVADNSHSGISIGSLPVSAVTGNTIVRNGTREGDAGIANCINVTAANNIIAFNFVGIERPSGSGAAVLRNNCVYGNTQLDYSGIAPGVGDISADPLFAGSFHGNYHIQPDSPCRDAGWNEAPGLTGFDIDSQVRIEPPGGTVDIGADESDGTLWPAGPYAVVRVKPDGDDRNDGSTWDLAKRTVQAAIDRASLLGGEVWVAAGVYKERIGIWPCAYLYGGFAGTETARRQRDWRIHRSVLDGDRAGTVVKVRCGHGVSTIDGFTICNGFDTRSSGYPGGIVCSYSSPAISNNLVTGNVTRTATPAIESNHGSPVITRNVISHNYKTGAVGMACGIGIGLGSSAIVSNNLLYENGDVYGAAIGTWSKLTPVISNNTVVRTGKSLTMGGIGIYCGGPAVISNNIVASNRVGIHRKSGAVVLRNNNVFGNRTADYDGTVPGEGDISVDPLFLAPWVGDYHLRPGSPCIDRGYNDDAGSCIIDLDGRPRFFDDPSTPDTGVGTAPIVDIGCFEWSTAPYRIEEIGQARAIPDGTEIELSSKPVSAVFDNAFYIEEPERTGGIRVISSDPVQPGDLATMVARVAFDGPERALQPVSLLLQSGDASNIPNALGLPVRSLGGGNYHFATSPESRGQPGITGAFGLNNIGLLVRVSGAFTYIDADTFLIDDGSGASVKCIVPDGVSVDPGWTFVGVTGISSCEASGGELHRVLLLRNGNDIAAF